MTKPIKVDLGDAKGSIWVEAVEVDAERPQGRASVAVGAEVVANLADFFDQLRGVFEIAQT